MPWRSLHWRVHKVRIACKTGFLATLSFCLIELVLIPRASPPYESRNDVAVQGILKKKKADAVDYGSSLSFHADPVDGAAEIVAKRKLSSGQWNFAESGLELPPNLGNAGRKSHEIPQIGRDVWGIEQSNTNRHFDEERRGEQIDRGRPNYDGHEVFIQVNKTKAISTRYSGNGNAPQGENGPVQLGKAASWRKLPFENPGYAWRNDGPGERGKGVEFSGREENYAESLFSRHQFNVLASDQIAINRTLPDERPPRCRMFRYRRDLPSASVIIVFHNEARSVLLRTIASVIARSPTHLLEEIVLVDDASNLEEDWYGSWLEHYLSQLPFSARLIRMPSRSGVVGARLAGLSAASSGAEVLVFLDSHCECVEGWLEPLLDCIQRNRTRVVSPAIDSISDTDFSYTFINGMARTGGFNWFPEFMWNFASPREMKRVWHDTATPLRTPTIAGGLFAIDRAFFKRLGYYDPELKVWGSENLELSFKVWQCGGSLEVVPCSRVGHVFRSKPAYDIPGNPEEVFLRNNKRVLEVWTGKIKNLFYGLTPEYSAIDAGDLSSRIQLREKLQCRSFEWYLKTVYPQHILPLEFQEMGRIMNNGVDLCVDVLHASDKRRMGAHIALTTCREGALSQTFSWNMDSQLQHDHFCITSVEGDNCVMLLGCQAVSFDRRLTNQQWQYDDEIGTMVHQLSGLCMGLAEKIDKNDLKLFVVLEECDALPRQQWTILDTFTEITWR